MCNLIVELFQLTSFINIVININFLSNFILFYNCYLQGPTENYLGGQ